MRSIGWALVALLAACGGENKAQQAQGEIGGHCYPNGTCNVTLDCVGGICIAAVDAGVDAAVDAMVDAAIDAPPDAAIDAPVCDNQFEPNEMIQTAYLIPLAQTGQLLATFTTTPVGSVYAPLNVAAVWVEQGGAFVKTAGRWADVRKGNLVAWNAKAGVSDADAISGATRQDHASPLTLAWDLKDRLNNIVPDDTYTLRMELADGNSTAAGQNNQGSFTFTKGTQSQTQSGLSSGGFTNVSLNYTPTENRKTIAGVSICPFGDVDHYRIDVLTANTNLEVIVTYSGSGAPVTASILGSGGATLNNSVINGTNSARAYVANLPVATYYAAVRATNGVSDYQVTITRTHP